MRNNNHWHEDLPAVYRAELDTLQHGLTYFAFSEQVPFEQTNGRLIVKGELTFGEEKKQIIRIVFPHSYPYSPPEVFPVQRVQMPQGIVEADVAFGKGNQYGNGKICLFREEDEWIPFTHGVGMALGQAKHWLETAVSKEGFTKNLIVEENNPVIAHTGQVLFYLPQDLPEAAGGRLLLKSFKENYYSLLQLHFDGPEETVVINTLPDGTVLSSVRSDVVFGQWFRLQNSSPKEVLPHLQSSDAFKAFLVQSVGIDVNDILPNPGHVAKKIVVGFLIGDSKELHCFQISYWKQGTQTMFQSAYLLPKNLTQELFVRISSLFNLDILASKRVLVVGLGSIGSEVVKDLAASSIGDFTVIDDEPYEAGNSVRHAADLQYLGESKVEIAKKLIQARNPQAKVRVVPSNILDIPQDILAGLLEETDVVLDLTANKLVEEYLNQKVFIDRKIPLLQGAVSKGGLTGIVLALIPGSSACLKCLAERELNYVPVSALKTDMLKDTPPDYGACSKAALPASGLDTREVALQTSRVTLQILLQNEDAFYPKLPGHQFYWHGPAGSKSVKKRKSHKPFEWEIQSVKPLESCEICKIKND